MAFERAAAGIGEAHAYAAATVRHRAIDGDVTGVLQRRELLRQCGVGETEAIADEREVDPVCRGQQCDDRQACARVDELVETRGSRSRVEAPFRARRAAATNLGPPSSTAIATTTLATVTGCSAPLTWATTASTIVTATSPIRPPNTNSGRRRSTTSARTLSCREPWRPDSTCCATAECTAPKVNVATNVSHPIPKSAITPSATQPEATPHQYQRGMSISATICRRRVSMFVSADRASASLMPCAIP